MSEWRMVAMTNEQYDEINACIVELMRRNKNERAVTLMNLANAYRFASTIEQESTNVIPFPGYSVRV